MLRKIFWLVLATILFAQVSVIYAQQAEYSIVTTEQLKEMIDSKQEPLTIVDARGAGEYQEVHIKDAINIPAKEFNDHISLLPTDKSAKIVFYCNGIKCGKSKKAAKKALAAGFENVVVYADGMPVWEEKGMPIYAGPDYEKRIETTKLTPQDLHTLVASGKKDFVVVDVRDLEEYQESHIPGSINIPVQGFAAASEVLDKKKMIIVYCNSGGRSYNAYRKLMKLSYKNIRQAIFYDWKEAGFDVAPVEGQQS